MPGHQASAHDRKAAIGSFRERIHRLRAVPTLPKLLGRVVEALDDPDVNFENVAELIEVDQSLTAIILRLANSAFYNSQGSVSRITDALLMLGTGVTRSVAVAASVFDLRASRELVGFWEHSLGCAVAAGALAKATKRGRPEEVTAAGLLHDIGKVVLYKHMPDAFEHIRARVAAEARSFRDVEHEVLGVDHADVAGWMIERWRFPPVLAEPILHHHRPSGARTAQTETAIVHVANSLVRALDFGYGGDQRIGPIDAGAWALLDLTAPVLDAVLDNFDADLDRALNYALFE